MVRGNVIETSQTDVAQVSGVANEVFLTTNFYDSRNRVQETVDNLGDTSYRRYDSLNHLVAIADANGPAAMTSIMRRAFAAGRRTVNMINNFGNVTLSYYDGLGRKTRQEVILTASGLGDGVHPGADADGVINTSSDPMQTTIPTPDLNQGGGDGIIRTGYLWDQNSLQAGLLDDQGNLTVSLHDNLNRQVADIKGLVVTSSLTKTALLGSRTLPTPTVATLNNPATIPDVQINSQLTETSSRVSAVAALFRSLANQIVSPLATLTGYDPDNNVLIRVDPNGTAVYTKYDAIDRALDVRVFRAGQHDAFSGDALFAPAPTSLPSGTATVVGTTKQDVQYDGLSRRTTASDNNDPSDASAATVVADAYDSLGRIIEDSQQVGTHPAQVVSSAWRAANLRSQLTYPNGRVEQYRYDHLDRIQSIIEAGTTLVTYAYIGTDRVLIRQLVTQTGMTPHSLTETYLDSSGTVDSGYDGLGRPVLVHDVKDSGALVVGFGYVYDHVGNTISQRKLHALSDSELYGYDSANRLVSLQRGTLDATGKIITGPPAHAPRQSSWNLDGAGNFQQVNGVARTFSTTNAIVQIGTTAHTFDSDGNETTDGVYQLSWDFENRLHTVTQVGAGGLLIATYGYTADGQRDRQVVTNSGALNGETDFYLDGEDEIEEHNSGDTVLKQYVYGGGVNEPVLLDPEGSARLFYSQDELGSVYALTTASGDIQEGYLYDAYGQQTVFTPGSSGAVTFTSSDNVAANGVSAVGNDYLYTGMHFDAQTAADHLYYVRARYYNAVEARFVSWDPMGYAAGDSNLYNYVSNDPTGATDPLGLYEWPWSANASWSFKGSLLGDVVEGVVEVPAKFVDVGQAGVAGVWIGFGGEPYEPHWVSDLAQKAPLMADQEKTLQYLKDKELENLRDGAIAIGILGAAKVGGKVLNKVLGKGKALVPVAEAESKIIIAPKVGSTGIEIAEAEGVRFIKKGERVKDLVKELAERTYTSGGKEHAIISFRSGVRVIVKGGSGGIDFTPFNRDLRRVILHTHPRPTGPSPYDFNMLNQLGQRSSWVYELFGGGLSKFSRP